MTLKETVARICVTISEYQTKLNAFGSNQGHSTYHISVRSWYPETVISLSCWLKSNEFFFYYRIICINDILSRFILQKCIILENIPRLALLEETGLA